jgi:hypothetical protein
VADWQGEIRGQTFGAAQPWEIDEPGIPGLGIPVARTRVAVRVDRHGDVGGDDVLPRRILSVPLVATFASPGAAWQAFETELKPAWAESFVDETLDLYLPGLAATGRRYFGRARGVDVDLSRLKSSTVRALCTFEALDPLGYGPEESSGPEAGAFVVTNGGTADSDRVTLSIIGNGGSPRLVNASDSSNDVSFDEPLGAADVRVVDLRSRTVVDGAGDDRYDELSPALLWFVLVPGANSLALTGAASVDVSFRPAYR